MADTLIIYYSSTGYNKKVAQLVADKIDADVFQVEPVKPYSKDMWAAWDVAKKERDEDSLPELKTGYPEMSQYQRIIFGGPAWGYTLANPLQTFLKNADFAGKPVYPWVTFYDHDEKYLADLKEQLHNGQVHDLLELTMGILGNDQTLNKTLDDWLTQIQ
ncbi:flavodoxin [uncultured Limosilactobacillus sp.]|uniref:flavodoxin n=1 Tax=uncultured Limosilactobacillus sp. TaxID=2837629 RepID=UPI0025FFE23E|nr:flavodoxin [uncultured Limosilactobacillus sp.]